MSERDYTVLERRYSYPSEGLARSMSSAFRGPLARRYMNGELLQPQTETMARIHQICNITPRYYYIRYTGSLGAFGRHYYSGSRLNQSQRCQFRTCSYV
ncbi:hypothetical protein BYT27DRAFT_7180272, partial [Phlegmacium glaucopus]